MNLFRTELCGAESQDKELRGRQMPCRSLLLLLLLPALTMLSCQRQGDDAKAEARVNAEAYDAAIEREDIPEAIEAREFLQSPFSGVPITHEAVDTAYKHEAKRVWVSYEEIDGRIPLSLIIELPEEADKRTALFKAMNELSRKMSGTEDAYSDQGSKYLMFFLEGA